MNETYQIRVEFDTEKFNIGYLADSFGLMDTTRFSLGTPNFVVFRTAESRFTEELCTSLEDGLLAIVRQIAQECKSLLDYKQLVEFLTVSLADVREEAQKTNGELSDKVYTKENYAKIIVETPQDRTTCIGDYIFERIQMDSYSRIYDIEKKDKDSRTRQTGFLSFNASPQQPNSASSIRPVKFEPTVQDYGLSLTEGLILYCSVGGIVSQELGDISKKRLDDAWQLQVAIWKFISSNVYLPMYLRNIAFSLLHKVTEQS